MVWTYTITEYDPAEPWIVVATSRDSVELPEGASFYDWARELPV